MRRSEHDLPDRGMAACPETGDEVPSNTPSNRDVHDVIAARIVRRGALTGGPSHLSAWKDGGKIGA